ncbi:hypothetical protein R1sor_020876 [Riccia sorocarpa]|uniref:Uncharacterized protein n=1 Tax=Riccia sorocarpa TaxID=122646 RepID=A0ABD3GIS6_9MARC
MSNAAGNFTKASSWKDAPSHSFHVALQMKDSLLFRLLDRNSGSGLSPGFLSFRRWKMRSYSTSEIRRVGEISEQQNGTNSQQPVTREGLVRRTLHWIDSKTLVYNVTFGLYMLDWWERLLFNMLVLVLLWFVAYSGSDFVFHGYHGALKYVGDSTGSSSLIACPH